MRFFYFIIPLIVLTQSHSYAQDEENKPSFAEVHIYPVLEKSIDQNSQFILMAGAAATLATNPADDHIHDDWKDHHYMSKDNAHAGDLIGSGAAGVLALGGQYLWDDEHDNWKSHARALVWSTVVSSVMKYSFGRPRPGHSDDHHSFPSGHTTTAFTTATSLTYAYGWKAAVVAYPIATFVGLSRLSDGVHWGSDVVAGAFIGVWAARASFYSTRAIEDKPQYGTFFPIVRPDGPGVSWVYPY